MENVGENGRLMGGEGMENVEENAVGGRWIGEEYGRLTNRQKEMER